jgi:cytochrome c peroxidase
MKRNVLITVLIFCFFALIISKEMEPLHPFKYKDYSYSNNSNSEHANTNLTIEGIALGRLLFYDTLLSGNNKQSCGSCHQQKYGFTDGKPTSIGSNGAIVKRNSMSLQNLAFQDHFFWDGRVNTLEKLITIPIQDKNEMNQNMNELIQELNNHPYYSLYFKRVYNDSIRIKYIENAISQFLKSIVSFNTKMEVFQFENPLEYLNETDKKDKIFVQFITDHKKGKMGKIVNICGNCHGDLTYGNKKFSTNGFVDTSIEKGLYNSTLKNEDIGLLKVPTLRNIKQTAPYMHNGSLKTLEEVLKHYSTHIRKIPAKNLSSEFKDKKGNLILPKLNKKEIAHLMQMFDYMTDSIYLNNKAYSNPFEYNFSWEKYSNMYYLSNQ